MLPDQKKIESMEFKASYIRTVNKDVIGGKLQLNNDALVFKPNSIAKKAGEDGFRIPLYNIEKIRKESAGRGVIYSLTNGKLAGHLHIILNEDTEYVFTVSSVDKKIEILSSLIEHATKNEMKQQELEGENSTPGEKETTENSKTDSENTNPQVEEKPEKENIMDGNDKSARFPILSIFSSLMLFRLGVSGLGTSQGTPDVLLSVLVLILGIAVIPRVRISIHNRIMLRYEIDLTKLLWSIGIALIYIFFVALSSMLLIGQGGVIGIFALILVFAFSAIIVITIRVVKRLS